MDLTRWKKGIKEYFEKYKYVLIVLLAGIVLMLLPDKNIKKESPQEVVIQQAVTEDVAQQLEEILSQVSGAGKVKVMISLEKGEETIYQTDTSSSQSENGTDNRIETILITDSNRNQSGLIRQINPPAYQGAIILAQGGNDPVVKLAIVDAVSKATGLGADKISVLKMK